MLNPELVKVVVTATGIAGLALLVLYALYRPMIGLFMEKFPKVSQQQATWIILIFMLLIFCVVLVGAAVYLAPGIFNAIYERQVDIVLRDPENKKLNGNFDFRFKIAERAYQSGRGEDGIASITGVPRSVKRLAVDVTYPGYDQVLQDEEYEIKSGGVVTVTMMVSKKLQPKTTSKNSPRPPTFTEAEKAEFAKPSVVQPGEVTFYRRNLTAKPLDLLLYDCTEEIPSSDGILSADGAMSTWDIPQGQDGKFNGNFKKGNGWFFIWVREGNETWWPLGKRNLFLEKKAYLTIRETGMKDQPYSADFSPWSIGSNGLPHLDDASGDGVRGPSNGTGPSADKK